MKLIAMDLDGTLLTKDKRVSDFNRDILNKKSMNRTGYSFWKRFI